MPSHFAILPSDIVQYLSLSLNDGPTATPGLHNSAHQPLQILRLPHPRTGLPSLFLPLEHLQLSSSVDSSNTGILEIQAVCPPDERSWIVGGDVVADGKMLTMTPIDPAFLLLPILQTTQPIDGSSVQFRTLDDLFEEATNKLEISLQEGGKTTAPRTQDIHRLCSLACTRKALSRLCEVREISPEIIVYRYSPTKFLKYLRAKVTYLESSVVLDKSQTVTRNLAKEGLMDDEREDLLCLGRTQACCDLLSQYLPSEIYATLLASYDFSSLQKLVQANRDEALAAAAVAAPPAKGKGSKADLKAATAADGKKRKATKASQGVEKLKKANTTGMSKLSSFFAKS
ncbi:hypothetical protein NLJ89_g6244 [Agrocybe chaxingu]|uniref:Ribonuclease H2 subunit B n=1 Tax=Agrocybe chaxingu TaxID=84603 RepID=A0A9W8JZI4_9AGAR|nr:hypothetical protein NLJ89_g6244 [Agrocybe chaxingu]